MCRSWRSLAVFLILGGSPLTGCVQLQPNKSVQDLRPTGASAKPGKDQELTALDISQSLLQQADQFEKTGKTADAIAAYQKMRLSNGADAQLATRKLAILYYRAGEIERAEKEFQVLKLQNPKDSVTLTYLGDINYQRGMWGAAELSYRDALFHQPKHAEARTGLGMTLAQNERYDLALEEFASVVSKAEAYCCVARVMTQQGKRQDAVRAYEQALRLDPTMLQARSELERLRQGANTVTMTTHYKTGRGTAELMDDVPAAPTDGTSRSLQPRPTLPPLPDSLTPPPDWQKR